jgi:hypothetical protein
VATLDQQGNILPDTPAAPARQLPDEELPEVQVIGHTPTWPQIVVAALLGMLLAEVLKPGRSRR